MTTESAPPVSLMDDEDPRPPVWVGHIGPHIVDNLDEALEFYVKLGMRVVAEMPHMAVLELRGGTHLIVQAGEPATGGSASFDLMVDDLDATHDQLTALGLDPTTISRGRIHDAFTVTDPTGWIVTFNSSHVSGPV